MNLKKKLASAVAVGAIILGALLVSPVAANATGNPSKLDRGDFTIACMNQYGRAGWSAKLYGSTAYSWKCVYNNNDSTQKNVDINAYCMNLVGAWAATPVASNPYSWKCQGY